MAKIGTVGVALRERKVKRTKSERPRPGRRPKKKYRGQGRL